MFSETPDLLLKQFNTAQMGSYYAALKHVRGLDYKVYSEKLVVARVPGPAATGAATQKRPASPTGGVSKKAKTTSEVTEATSEAAGSASPLSSTPPPGTEGAEERQQSPAPSSAVTRSYGRDPYKLDVPDATYSFLLSMKDNITWNLYRVEAGDMLLLRNYLDLHLADPVKDRWTMYAVGTLDISFISR